MRTHAHIVAEKNARVLDAAHRLIQAGEWPSYRRIAEVSGLSPTVAKTVTKRLKRAHDFPLVPPHIEPTIGVHTGQGLSGGARHHSPIDCTTKSQRVAEAIDHYEANRCHPDLREREHARRKLYYALAAEARRGRPRHERNGIVYTIQHVDRDFTRNFIARKGATHARLEAAG
jgi:hypothetical protein